jgi:hypothetical protein
MERRKDVVQYSQNDRYGISATKALKNLSDGFLRMILAAPVVKALTVDAANAPKS